MKKRIEFFLITLCLLGFSGCTPDHEEPTPTGYPSGEVQRPQIMYNGVIISIRRMDLISHSRMVMSRLAR